ncbi:MAG: ComEA family DNA-binding protein [Campylobacterales bacterium]|nr:ComEA family DNA-binding protein [Campylobacterales bacterium]
MKILMTLVLGSAFLCASVDINSATAKELTTLKGIGLKKAEAIVAYRESNCFKTLNDLTHVKGVGEKFIENNKDEISIGACKH